MWEFRRHAIEPGIWDLRVAVDSWRIMKDTKNVSSSSRPFFHFLHVCSFGPSIHSEGRAFKHFPHAFCRLCTKNPFPQDIPRQGKWMKQPKSYRGTNSWICGRHSTKACHICQDGQHFVALGCGQLDRSSRSLCSLPTLGCCAVPNSVRVEGWCGSGEDWWRKSWSLYEFHFSWKIIFLNQDGRVSSMLRWGESCNGYSCHR